MMEISFPVVYVEESFRSHAIDGVPTRSPQPEAPDWTHSQAHDPGLTLLELARWLPWSLFPDDAR